MKVHGSCAARDDAGVLLMGPPGSGKSDLILRLIDRGFTLVADDQVDIAHGFASPAAALAGLLEVRGLGIMRMSYRHSIRLVLVVELATGPALTATRIPPASPHPTLGLPVITIDGSAASAPLRVALALECALGRADQMVGAFV